MTGYVWDHISQFWLQICACSIFLKNSFHESLWLNMMRTIWTLWSDLLQETKLYEGRLISNAHSGISRKRDHVFKQTKIGSKVQYFSYKLTYLFFDIVALSSMYFSQCKTSLCMPSMKNSGVLCLIHYVTACFTSSSEVKWFPLRSPLEVRKEMEIAWRQVRAVGRMGENLRLQRLQSINHCASSVRSCIVMQQQNWRCWFRHS